MQPSAASAPAFYGVAIPHPLFAAPCKLQWTAEGRKAHGSRQLQMHRIADSAYAQARVQRATRKLLLPLLLLLLLLLLLTSEVPATARYDCSNDNITIYYYCYCYKN